MNKRVFIILITFCVFANSLFSQENLKLMFYNVVNEQLQLQITNSDVNSLTIYNTIGQIVRRLKTNDQTTMLLDVSKLANGVYYITASNKLFKPLKFVIQ